MKRIFYVLLALPFLGWTFLDPVAQKNEEGNSLFEKGEYEAALGRYLEAQQSAQNRPELHFNAGGALYKQGKYVEAIQEFERVTSGSNDQLSAMAYYNIGNSQFRLKKYQEAIEAYETSLKINTEDLDTKINLEIALSYVLSYYAMQLKEKADNLVGQYKFREAHDLMLEGLNVDPTVKYYQAFIKRLKDIVDIEDQSR